MAECNEWIIYNTMKYFAVFISIIGIVIALIRSFWIKSVAEFRIILNTVRSLMEAYTIEDLPSLWAIVLMQLSADQISIKIVRKSHEDH